MVINVDKYSLMMRNLKQAANTLSGDISPEYSQIADLFKAEGKYGTGAISRIKTQNQAGLSADMAAAAGAGMSSQAITGGLRSRYVTNATNQMQQVEDARYDKLSAAMAAVAAAKEARKMNLSGVYTTTADLLNRSYATDAATATAKAQIDAANFQARLDSATRTNVAAMNNQAAADLAAGDISNRTAMNNANNDTSIKVANINNSGNKNSILKYL